MRYTDFYQVLRELEQGAGDPNRSEAARLHMVHLLTRAHARMTEMGLTREKLADLAKGNDSFVLKPGKRQSSRPVREQSAAVAP